MKKETRNYLLSQVNIVLQECQRLVSELSIIDVSHDDQDQDVRSFISASVSHVSHAKEAPPEPDDSDQFWWDNYVSELSQFSSEFYSLVYDDLQDDLNQAHDDDEVRELQLGQHWRSECLLSPSCDPGDGRSLQSNDRQSRIQSINLKPKPPVDKIIQKILSVISSSSPNYVYRKQWMQELIDNFINPEFQEIWRNSTIIFGHEEEQEEVVSVSSPPPPVFRYPTIDLTNIDSRRIANVPRPQSCPVLGCSEDPNFYERISWDVSGPNYWRPQPHGSKLGYVTVMGVVTPPTTPVHGYVWSDTDGWVLNAVKPSDGCNTTKKI